MCHLSLPDFITRLHNEAPVDEASHALDFQMTKKRYFPGFIFPCSNYCHSHLLPWKGGGMDDLMLIIPIVTSSRLANFNNVTIVLSAAEGMELCNASIWFEDLIGEFVLALESNTPLVRERKKNGNPMRYIQSMQMSYYSYYCPLWTG